MFDKNLVSQFHWLDRGAPDEPCTPPVSWRSTPCTSLGSTSGACRSTETAHARARGRRRGDDLCRSSTHHTYGHAAEALSKRIRATTAQNTHETVANVATPGQRNAKTVGKRYRLETSRPRPASNTASYRRLPFWRGICPGASASQCSQKLP